MPTDILEIIRRLARSITVTHLVCLAGLALFAWWLVRTSLGRKSLADSLPRRNNMPPYAPFIALFLSFAPPTIVKSVATRLLGDLPGWRSDFLDNIIQCICAAFAIAIIILLARVTFVRRLKGFGLDPRTIHRDFAAALMNLLATWPLVLAMIIFTAAFGKLVRGPNFEIQQHEELKLIIESSQLSLRILIVLLAVLVVPLLEELLFRGLFQTVIRSYLVKPWLAIAVSSLLFVSVHQNIEHWPALFVLAMCLGYAYEKSGSLFRPIFIHAFFNGVTIAAALSQ